MRALVERLRQPTHDREVLGLIPVRVKKNSVCTMDVLVGYPHKQLGAEAYYYVMINAPMICLTLNRLQPMIATKNENNYSEVGL